MNQTCPAPATLQSFSLGQLSEEKSDKLLTHLMTCESCQTELGTLETQEDTFVQNLKRSVDAVEDQFSSENECRIASTRALAALAQIEGAHSNGAMSNVPREIGEYEVVQPLGFGGMGHVFEGRHTKLGRKVAIKFIADHRRWDRTTQERFAAEMRNIGRLEHPNIVAAHDAREVDGLAVLVTEYIDGLNVSEIVKRQGKISIADSCEIAQRVCDALGYIDSQGLIHRDVKPSNIMIDKNGNVKLLDLGLARLQNDEHAEFTATGQAVGTADYVSPEQINDSRNVDIRADIYALGCTLYKLLSGRAPFAVEAHTTAFAKMNAHVSETPEPIKNLRPGMPNELATLVMDMLKKEPSQRPQTTTELAKRLAPFSKNNSLAKLVEDSVTQVSLHNDESRSAASPTSKAVSPQPQSFWARIPWVSVLAMVAASFLFGAWLGIIVSVKKPDGSITKVEIPDGSSAVIDAQGNIAVQLAGEFGSVQIPKERVESPHFSATTSQFGNSTTVPIGRNGSRPGMHEVEPETIYAIKLPKNSNLSRTLVKGDMVDILKQPKILNWKNALSDFSKLLISEIPVENVDASNNTVSIRIREEAYQLLIGQNQNELHVAFHGPDRALDSYYELLAGVWRPILLRANGDSNFHQELELSFIFNNQNVYVLSAEQFEGQKIELQPGKLGTIGFKLSSNGTSSSDLENIIGQTGTIKLFMPMTLQVNYQQHIAGQKTDFMWRLEKVEEAKNQREQKALDFVSRAKQYEKKIEFRIATKKQKDISKLDPYFLVDGKTQGTNEWIGPVFITNKDLVSAEKHADERGQWGILVELTQSGAERMAFLSEKNLKNKLQIWIDDKLKVSPTIYTPISTHCILQLNITEQEAEDLATAIIPNSKNALQLANKNVQIDSRKTQSANNLRQIVLAMLNYESAHGGFPPSQKQIEGHSVSWRVLLLPFLGEAKLYEEYRFDEPWDSEHNLNRVAARMPNVYRHPLGKSTTRSVYVGIVGEGTALQKDKMTKLLNVKDGTSLTGLIVETQTAIPWTKPEDIPFENAWASIVPMIDGQVQVGMTDGSIKSFAHGKIDSDFLGKLFSRSGGEYIDLEAVEQRQAR